MLASVRRRQRPRRVWPEHADGRGDDGRSLANTRDQYPRGVSATARCAGICAAATSRAVDPTVRRPDRDDRAVLGSPARPAFAVAVNRHRGGAGEMVGPAHVPERLSAAEHHGGGQGGGHVVETSHAGTPFVIRGDNGCRLHTTPHRNQSCKFPCSQPSVGWNEGSEPRDALKRGPRHDPGGRPGSSAQSACELVSAVRLRARQRNLHASSSAQSACGPVSAGRMRARQRSRNASLNALAERSSPGLASGPTGGASGNA